MSEDIMRDNLCVLTHRYAQGHGLTLTTVSKRIHGNQRFLEDYISGKPGKTNGHPLSTTIRLYFRMVDEMRDTWPKDTPWPQTRQMPKLGRFKHNPMTKQKPRGDHGKFVGKKSIKGSKTP